AALFSADPIRVKQIFFNLIGNALKFTPSGHVAIAASAESLGDATCSVLVEVSDSGTGLSEAQQAQLFQPFVQLDPAASRQAGGGRRPPCGPPAAGGACGGARGAPAPGGGGDRPGGGARPPGGGGGRPPPIGALPGLPCCSSTPTRWPGASPPPTSSRKGQTCTR